MANIEWGPWHLIRSNLTLKHSNGYEVDLETCSTSAETLDWVAQVADKSWADSGTVVELVNALLDILEPQKRLCSCGVEMGPIDVKSVVKDYLEHPEHPRRRTLTPPSSNT